MQVVRALVLVVSVAFTQYALGQCELDPILCPEAGPGFGGYIQGAGATLVSLTSDVAGKVTVLRRQLDGSWDAELELHGDAIGELTAPVSFGSERTFVTRYDLTVVVLVSWWVRTPTGWESPLGGYKRPYDHYAVSDGRFASVTDGGIAVETYDFDLGGVSYSFVAFPLAWFDTELALGGNRVFVTEAGTTFVFEEGSEGWFEHSTIPHHGRPSPGGTLFLASGDLYRYTPRGWTLEASFSGEVYFSSETRLMTREPSVCTVYDFDGVEWSTVGSTDASDLSISGPFTSSGVVFTGDHIYVGRPTADGGAVLDVLVDCGPDFIRGNCNGLSLIEVADAVTSLNYLCPAPRNLGASIG